MRWWLVLAQIGCGFAPAASNTPPLEAGTVIDTPDVDTPIDGPPIPILYVQGNTMITSNTSALSLAASYAAPQTAGNLNVVIVSAIITTDNLTSISDLDGNTYTSLGFMSHNNYGQWSYFAPNIHASAPAVPNVITVTFGSATDRPELRLAEYSGIAADPLDASVIGTGTTDFSDSGPITTLNAHDLIVGANTVSQSSSGPGANYTQRVIIQGDIFEDREVMTTNTYHATAPLTQTSQWVMLVAAFKGAR